MKNRLIAYLLLLMMVLPGICTANAEDLDAVVLDCFEVSSGQAFTVEKYSLENLTDVDEKTSTMFSDVNGAKIDFAAKVPVNINGVKIAVENFPGWRNIKEITVTYDGKIKDTIYVENFMDDVKWFEGSVSAKNVSDITVEITGVYDNNSSTTGALAEVQFLGTALGEYEKGGELAFVAAANRKLKYASDYSYVTTNSKIATVANWFDENYETHTNISQLKGGFIVLQFKYPTDVTAFSLSSVYNNDWAMIKELEFGFYNLEHPYRARLKYPEPAFEGKSYAVEKTSAKQKIDLSGCPDMKQVTHLIVRCNDAYEFASGATWGGVTEFEVEGVPNTSSKPVAELIKTELISNPTIITEWGLLGDNFDGDIYRQPTRIQAADMILRLNGEYEKAQSYVGTFNFRDATDKPCALNRLSYIFAYKKFGIEGDEYGNFKPNKAVQPQEFYKMMLCAMGYEYGKDFTWDTIPQVARAIGMGDMLYTEPFEIKDMCNVLWEALNAYPKDSHIILAEKLHNEGLMPDNIWSKFGDKYDKQVVVMDRTPVEVPETANKSGDFTFMMDGATKEINDYHFMYNACYHYSGVYYGTLPRDNPESQRDAFAQALKDIGARTLRWPGGNTVHWYFMEEGSKKHVDTLFEDAAKFNGVRPGGFYDPKDPDDAYYAEYYDFLSFCKEFDIEPFLQINPIYYIDEGDENNPDDDRVRSVILSNLNTKANADGSRYTIPGYYDRNRIEEGAEDLRKNLQEMKRRGYECYMWEIGNEDHWKDYDGSEYGSNKYVQDMFDMYVAYTKVIKEEFPGSIVCIDTFDVAKAVETGVITLEEANLFDAITDHYPFARWGGPAVNTDSGKRNAWAFAVNNDALIEQAWINRETLNWGVPQRMMTESTAYRFQNWGSTSVEHTFAHALVLGHNWGQAVFDSGWTLACLHDLESPWLGFLQHNSTFNTGYRYFNRKYEGTPNMHTDDIPDNYKFFDDRYYTNPAGRAFDILGRHSGGLALENKDTNMSRYVAGYATVKDNQVKVTIVNRLNETRPVNICFKDIVVPKQTAQITELYSEDPFAVMKEDYFETDSTIEIVGNENGFENGAIVAKVKPMSVTQFTFYVK